MTITITAALVPLSTGGDETKETDLPVAESVRPRRLIAGKVTDSVLGNVPDICTEAAMERGWPKVTTKPAMQDGRQKMLCIMDEKRIDAPPGVAG